MNYQDKWRRFIGMDLAEAGPGKPLVDIEVATSEDGRDITRGYVDSLDLLVPEDPILQAKGGGNLTVYEQIYSHPDVKIAMDQRVLALAGKEWYVEPGGTMRRDKQAAESLQEMLATLSFRADEGTHSEQSGWDNATVKMQTAGVFFGYGVAECLFSTDGLEIRLDRIKIKKSRRFGFGPDGRLKLITTRQPLGEPVPPRKFWQLCCGAIDDDEPYGLGLAHWLYWPVWFLRNGHKFWAIYLDKYAQPTAVGKHPAGAGEPEKKKLLEAVRAIHRDSAITISDNMLIELLEASRSSGGDYHLFAEHWQRIIYRLILGQDFSVTGSGGQYKGENLMAVQAAVIKADSDLVNISFSRSVAAWLTDWNYPGAAVPRVWRRCEDAPDLSALADRDSKIFTMGYRPTLKQVTETYGGEWEPITASGPAQDETVPGNSGAGPDNVPSDFAEPPAASTVPEMLADRMESETGPAWANILDHVRGLVDQATSMAGLRDALLAAYADLPSDTLVEVMTMGFAAADLTGRFDAREDSDGGR